MQIADVGLLHSDHARVLPQRPGELVRANVYSIHPRRPHLQQHVGKPPGGSPYIERHLAGDVRPQPEDLDSVCQLQPAPAHVRQPGFHLDSRALSDGHARLVGPAPVHQHLARHHQRLRPRPALRKPPLDYQGVKAALHQF